MWTRLLFAVPAFNADLGPRLGSWRLSIVLMVLAALYYGFLAIWATSSPPHVVGNIAQLAPFWLVYLLLLVNTGVCLWRRLSTLKREIGKRPFLAARASDWELATGPLCGREEARQLLGRLGYRPLVVEDGSVAGVRRRWAALGTYLFHAAFFLVAIGFLLTLAARQEAKVWVAVGEEFKGDPSQFLSQSPPRWLASGVSVPDFRVTEIRPEFWRDQLLFTRLEAEVELAAEGRVTTRINRPLWLGWGTFLRLSGFGYTPRYELRDRFGHVIDSRFVKLNLFPPGQRDYFSPPELPHRIYLEIYPDFVVEDGDPASRSLNLNNPAVAAQIYRGRFELGNALLRPEDSYTFEGLSLQFPEIRYWGEFAVVRDLGAPILFLGYLLGLAGLLLKIRGGRAEVRWTAGGEGEARRLEVGGSDPPELSVELAKEGGA